MIPPTINGLPSMACVSAMQKCIRRGMEREAMEFACELLHTSKAFCTMVCNRLEIIVHEDIDSLAEPWLVPYVHAACTQAKARYKVDKPGEARLVIGNAIRMLCKAEKSRAGTHFAAAVGLRALFEGFIPEIPDWANDMHTLKGKRLGRGLEHFRKHGAKLVPAVKGKDKYEDEAYRLFEYKYKGKK